MKKGKKRSISPEEIEEIKYRHRSVKEILTEMRDISEKIVDLAYSALVFDSPDMADEVTALEYKMDKLLYEIRLAAMLGARTVEDAHKLSGILQIASAAEDISNAAGDIVKLLDLDIESRVGLTFAFGAASTGGVRRVADLRSACGLMVRSPRPYLRERWAGGAVPD